MESSDLFLSHGIDPVTGHTLQVGLSISIRKLLGYTLKTKYGHDRTRSIKPLHHDAWLDPIPFPFLIHHDTDKCKQEWPLR